jgi:predicted acyl esterase
VRRPSLAAPCAAIAVIAVLVALLVVTTVPAPAAQSETRATPTFRVVPSVHQVALTGATTGATAVLRAADGKQVATRTIDALGSTLFRDVPAGRGYVVRVGDRTSEPVTVVDARATPPAELYSGQQLQPGYGYLKTRDGTLLSINVKLPGPVDAGPYPTVVEYSGYDPSNPDGDQPASRAAQLLGFATVGVNLRGTGCSGGAYNYFEELESLDGYDAVEAVAAQPWVQGGTVGMVGISFPGITQLFVAKTRPPHLAAITPLSVLDDTYDTLYPGGIFNNGFALEWAKDREADARPATRAGQGQEWARQRIADGDATCRTNQALRLQSADVRRAIGDNAYRRGAVTDALAPESFVHDIDVPVFIAGAWQDQETGSHFADMLDNFSPDIPMKITLMNGLHQDSLGPAVLSQWIEFLDFYVAKKIPSIPPAARALASLVLNRVFGKGATLAPDRFTDQPDYATALRAYESEPRVRVLFDVGAGHSPMPAFSTTATAFPLPATTPTTWYLGGDGALTDAPPSTAGADRFRYDPSAFPRTMTTSRDDITPVYGWKPVPDGKALNYVTAPLATDTVLAGTGSVDLWVRSSKRDVDLEVTISEVRPDGKETYVQSGWLRGSERALDDAASTALLPVQTHERADVKPLSATDAALVRVPLYPFAHAFRADSRIRIVVQPPGGNRPAWAFAAMPAPRTVTVSRSEAEPSKVVLPVVSAVDISTPRPECGTLRGQPCRPYQPLENRSAKS